MLREQISALVNEAIDQVLEQDRVLLELGVTERALAHWTRQSEHRCHRQGLRCRRNCRCLRQRAPW